MKKLFLCFTLVLASLLCFPINASAKLSEEIWNFGKQIEGLSVTEFSFDKKGQTIDSGKEELIQVSIKMNKELPDGYNVFVVAEKEDNLLEAQLTQNTSTGFSLERDEDDHTKYGSTDDGFILFHVPKGDYRFTYVGISSNLESEDSSQQLIELDKTISDVNSFKVTNDLYSSLQPTVKSISLDKTVYKEGDIVKVTVKTELPTEVPEERMSDELNLIFGTGKPEDEFYIAGTYLEMQLDLQSDGLTYYGEAEITDWFDEGNFKLQQFICNGNFVSDSSNWGGLFTAKFDKSIDLSKTYFTINNGTGEAPAEPTIPEINNKETIVQNIQKAQPGSSITIDMKSDTILSKDFLEAAKGKDINLVLEMKGYSWVVNGKTISNNIAKDINMSVNLKYANISESLVSSVAGKNYTKQISLAHNGDFGFDANLQLNFDQAQANKNSKLYYFNNGKLELVSNSQIDVNGKASYKFTHASDYVIVVEDAVKNTVVKTDDNVQSASLIFLSVASLTIGAIIFIQLRKKQTI